MPSVGPASGAPGLPPQGASPQGLPPQGTPPQGVPLGAGGPEWRPAPVAGPGQGFTPPGGPGGPFGPLPGGGFGSSSEPDWAALAEANESSQRRRRKLKIGGAVLGVVVVCGLVVGAFTMKPWARKSVTADPIASPTASVPVPGSGSGSGSGSSGSEAPSADASPVVMAPNDGRATMELHDAPVVRAHNGRAIQMYGRNGSYGRGSTQVVDVRKSFSVSAWVYNTAGVESRSAVSQGDQKDFSWDLGREGWGGHDNWAFKVQTKPGGSAKNVVELMSKSRTALNRWTLLTGTYDAKARRISLYVDGQLQSSAKVSGVWDAPGRTELGRVRYNSTWTDRWEGQLSQIQIWDRALLPTQAAALTTNGNGAGVAPAASWLVG
ncbi:LamG domain-containing protein [Phaeacidiphilus oryzae]|uniref:LamG domain-containing protein n=1 Tax=Phaeacidiphilus oryzae TaxID=348818 RepID=UPI0013786600|nr:LamG domain-containing protein [Phaeacidiphilus oryzae]